MLVVLKWVENRSQNSIITHKITQFKKMLSKTAHINQELKLIRKCNNL